jgi:helix-turn-helix protein
MSAATPKGALVIDGMSGEDLLRHVQEHRPTLYYQLINYLPSAKDARSGPSRPPGANSARGPPRLFTRAEVLAILRIGETTLFWLQRTGKLRPIRIGGRVLFNAAEIERLATHGATLSEAEKEAAAKRDPEATACSTASQLGRRARAREAPRPAASTG